MRRREFIQPGVRGFVDRGNAVAVDELATSQEVSEGQRDVPRRST